MMLLWLFLATCHLYFFILAVWNHSVCALADGYVLIVNRKSRCYNNDLLCIDRYSVTLGMNRKLVHIDKICMNLITCGKNW